MKRFILAHRKVREVDLTEWATYMETNNRQIARTTFPGDIMVSTVFLGLDHSFASENATPVLFESLVFGGPLDGHMDRYTDLHNAEVGHLQVCAEVIAALQANKGEVPNVKAEGVATVTPKASQ